MKTRQDLRTEFSLEIETLKRTPSEMKVGLKNSRVQLENSEESLTSRMNEPEDRTSVSNSKQRN